MHSLRLSRISRTKNNYLGIILVVGSLIMFGFIAQTSHASADREPLASAQTHFSNSPIGR